MNESSHLRRFIFASLAVPLLTTPAGATNYSGYPELLGGLTGGFLLALALFLGNWAFTRSRSWTNWPIWAGAAVLGLSGTILIAIGGFLPGESTGDALICALIGAGFGSLLALAVRGIQRLFSPRNAPVSLGETDSPTRVVKLVFFTLLSCFAAIAAIWFVLVLTPK